ncbi:MAG: acyl carrier protein [Acidobacteria bacterium]|nr:MAG: acyl carrier protein [Acidobacteriota bacterium]
MNRPVQGRVEVANLVIATLATHLNVVEQRVREDVHLVDDLGADSLDLVELVIQFEEMFSVEIPDDDAEQLTTVGDIVNMLTEKVSRKMVEEEEVVSPPVAEQPPEDPEEPQKVEDSADNEDEPEEGDEPDADENEGD